MIDDYLI